MNRRVLHLVRHAPPDPRMVQPGDLVVYTPESAPDSGLRGAHERLWRISDPAEPHDPHDPRPERPRAGQVDRQVDSRALCQLAFEYDSVIVW